MSTPHSSQHLKTLSDLNDWAKTALKHWKHGDTILLSGELGAGKTTLVRTIAEIIAGHAIVIRSPTFTIHSSYPEVGIEHFDLYRFDKASTNDLAEVGYFEAQSKGTLCFVEWPERVEKRSFLGGTYLVRLEILEDGVRQISEMIIPAGT